MIRSDQKGLRRSKRRILYWAACIVGVIASVQATAARADDYHYVNMIVGNRASGMGGAYTALSDDPAGCFYNPAGIAFAPSFSLSASANAYQVNTKTYRDVLTKTNGSKSDWEQKSSSLLPNFFGLVKRFDQTMVGFSYAVTDSIQRRQKQYFSNIISDDPANPIDTYMININDSDRTYLFGPTLAFSFGDSFAVGTTLYAYHRDKEIIRNQLIQYNKGEHFISNYYETQIDWGVRPSIGAIWEPIDRLAIGITLSKIIVMSNDSEVQDIWRDTKKGAVEYDSLEYDFDDTDTIYFRGVDTEEKGKYPLTTKLGVAYFFSPSLIFSGDIAYHHEIADKEAVYNFNFGCEAYLTDSIAYRFGVFTDMANTRDVQPDEQNQPEHIDIHGINNSITLFQRMTSITFGFSNSEGKGDAQIISTEGGDSADYPIQRVRVSSQTFYLSASYNY